MNITLSQACSVMATLQARVELCAMAAFRSNSATRGTGLRPGTRPSAEALQTADNIAGALRAVQHDLAEAQPGFAAILAAHPAANDPMHDQPGRA